MKQNGYLICSLKRYRIIIHALLTFLRSIIGFLFCFGGRAAVLEFDNALALRLLSVCSSLIDCSSLSISLKINFFFVSLDFLFSSFLSDFSSIKVFANILTFVNISLSSFYLSILLSFSSILFLLRIRLC
jgi:hypothetical protein